MTNIKDVMKVEHVCFYDDVSTKKSALLRVALQLKGKDVRSPLIF